MRRSRVRTWLRKKVEGLEKEASRARANEAAEKLAASFAELDNRELAAIFAVFEVLLHLERKNLHARGLSPLVPEPLKEAWKKWEALCGPEAIDGYCYHAKKAGTNYPCFFKPAKC